MVFAKLRAVKHRTNTAQNSIAMPASHLHPHHIFSGSNTTAPFATVAAKRPAGITVHASMLKERFLCAASVAKAAVLSSTVTNTAQCSMRCRHLYAACAVTSVRRLTPLHLGKDNSRSANGTALGSTLACKHDSKSGSFCADVSCESCSAVQAPDKYCMGMQHSDAGISMLHPHPVFSARTPLHLSQLSQRNGPLESRCMQACSKSGSLCADCGLCQAACCQAPDRYCTKQHSDAGISSASPTHLHGTNTTAPFATVAAKRPVGITVHASMLKERFLMR